MDWSFAIIDPLRAQRGWGYHPAGASASEPAALAVIALLAHGESAAALPALEWLLSVQDSDGSVGIEAGQGTPGWPTGWCLLAWQAAQESELKQPRFAAALDRALSWTLKTQGLTMNRERANDGAAGHDTTLHGWPWVIGTHSWLEPTAINLLALKRVGRGDHPRAEEARRMLHDRILPDGGCNYGNTIVFGQELRPHVQPTGLCLLALSGRNEMTPRIERSLEYLRNELTHVPGTSSLCFAVLALAAWKRALPGDDELLARAAERVLKRDPSAYKLSLLAIAALGQECPFIRSVLPTANESR
ncbi:MAG TPA: hypothetical protein VL175_11030 [Pirellulales bacterium]|jgi:hypothetical protein|nr:hypothetical protein [Pirellulales bacterium]